MCVALLVRIHAAKTENLSKGASAMMFLYRKSEWD